jgi:aspartyl protease family protein
MGLFLLLAVIAAGIVALLWPQDQLIAGVEAGDLITQSAFALVAVLLASSLLTQYRGRFAHALRDALAWIAIVLIICVAYVWRDAFEPLTRRITSELQPGRVMNVAPGVVEVVRRRDGHYVLDGMVGDTRMTFLFDTGASGIVLSAQDATRAGFDLGKLNFSTIVSTANGTTRTAPIMLDSLTIGSITQRNLRALVARPGSLDTSLLGQSFMDRLESYSVSNGRLTLRGKSQ